MPNGTLPQVIAISDALNAGTCTLTNSNITSLDSSKTAVLTESEDCLSQITKLVTKDKSSSVLTVAGQRSLSKKEWKHKHQSKVNASERERKGRLSAGINKLKELVPVIGKQLKTKENVIEEACKYICNLKKQIEELQLKDTSEVIATELKNLRKTVAELKNERIFYRSVLQSHGILPSLNTKVPWKSKKPIARSVKKHRSTQTPVNNRDISLHRSSPLSHSSSIAEKDYCGKLISTSVFSPEANSCINTTNCSISNEKSICITESSETSHCPPFTVSSLGYLQTSFRLKYLGAPLSCTCPSTSSINSTTDGNGDKTKVTFPELNLFHCKLTGAFCTPTYSFARIKPSDIRNDMPLLSSATADAIRQPSVENSKSSSKLTVNESQNAQSGSAENIIPDTLRTSGCHDETTTLRNTRLIAVSNINEVDNNHLVENIALTRSSEAAATVSMPALASQVMPKTFASSPPIASIAVDDGCRVGNTSGGGDNLINVSSQESSAIDRSLLSWLRSYEAPLGKVGEASATKISVEPSFTSLTKVSAPTAITNLIKQNPTNLEDPIQLTPSGKKETKSFNIASLMKSNYPMTLDNSPIKFVNQSTQPRESPFADTDFRSGTPKDIFHQSFENDILYDCFNISHFATPEPPTRQIYSKVDVFGNNPTSSTYSCTGDISTKHGSCKSSKPKDSNVSLDLNEFLQNEGSNPAAPKITFYHKDLNQQRISSHYIENTEFTDNAVQCSVNRSLMSANKGMIDRTILCSAPSNVSTSLWQPAINNTPSKHIASNFPDCFSSMSAYPYLSTSTQCLSHVTCAQSLNSFISSPEWMTRAPHDKFPVVSTNLPVFSSVFPSEPIKQKLQVPKKRKAARTVSTSKRKKSRVDQGALQKDTLPIPQAISYQYTTQAEHRHSNTQMHGLSNMNNASVTQSDRRIMFNPLTNAVVGSRPCVSYNHASQPNIFDSRPQTHSYHRYHVPYNHPSSAHPQHSSVHRYHFANTNNNNSSIPTTICAKPYKGSQHNIQQILS